jgi:hypothetical protein
MDVTDNQAGGFLLQIPRGLVQDSSIKFVGIPSGLLSKFQIELTGAQLLEEWDPPIILRSHKYPYAANDKYAYCPTWALSWKYCQQNLLQEIIGYNANILCHQEVQSDHFEEWQVTLVKELNPYEKGSKHRQQTSITPGSNKDSGMVS